MAKRFPMAAVLIMVAAAASAQDPFFTVGSSSADVERVQGGKPTSVTPYPGLGYDIWRYDWSQVFISSPGGKVLRWTDVSRNLKTVQPQVFEPVPPVSGSTLGGNANTNINMAAGFDLSMSTGNQNPGQNGQQNSINISGGGIPWGGGYDNGGGRRGRHCNANDTFPGLGGNSRWFPGYGGGFAYPSQTANPVVINQDTTVSETAPPVAVLGGQDPAAQAAPAAPALPTVFNVGASSSEVLRLQGNPDSVTPYPALGYDIWVYGWSQVFISNPGGKVIRWSNANGNLKIPSQPGD